MKKPPHKIILAHAIAGTLACAALYAGWFHAAAHSAPAVPAPAPLATLSAVLNDTNAALMTVSNLERVWVGVGVPENLLGQVAAGQKATVTLASQPWRHFAGTVGFVGTLLDADTRRARARIAFDNADGSFRPNMFATAQIELPQAAQPQVPSSALLMNNDSVSVFVEVQPWTFERRPVELGREDGERVRIRGGLAAGERVVVQGGVLLND
ncbi:efflux RND transporter periplasmic adaptor subunit [Variovorax sp. CT11-76]